jgi:hypothetical protein
MRISFLRPVGILAILLFTSIRGEAQIEAGIKIDRLEADYQDPFIQGTVGKGGASGKPGKWLVIKFIYSTKDASNHDEELSYLDELQFKIYVDATERKNPKDKKSGEPVVLVGDVTYVNIPSATNLMGCVFVHPDVVARYGGERDLGSKYNIRVEALQNGTVVAFKELKENDKEYGPNWFSSSKKIPNFILNKDQTPWITADTTGMPMIKRNGGE